MENWEKDFKWLELRHKIAASMNRQDVPDLQSILFLIGLQELGWWESKKFSKEEKQDLMHVGVCTLLEEDGFYEFTGRDHDGWPHFIAVKNFDKKGIEIQEDYLVRNAIKYFEKVYN